VPGRALVVRLAESLDVPLRERNALLPAAGYAPVYREAAYDSAELAPAREALEPVLAGERPRATNLGVAVPLRLRCGAHELHLLTTLAHF
jgi:hypothetical protein